MDSGNALFKHSAAKDADAKKRAAFILGVMGRLGTSAMAAGARDLVLGPAWLKQEANKAKVPVLSANLVDGAGKPLFPASKIVEVAGKKVALIGASPAGTIEGVSGAKGLPITAAVVAEAKKVRPNADVIVVLAAVPYADAMTLSRDAGAHVDLILQSHDARGQGPAQRGEGNYVMPSGERGRMVGRLQLGLKGSGPFFDEQEVARDASTLRNLETQTVEVKRRLKMVTDPSAKKDLENTLKHFEQRTAQLRQRQEAARKATGRTLSLEWMTLTPEFQDDAALAEEVRRIEPNPIPH